LASPPTPSCRNPGPPCKPPKRFICIQSPRPLSIPLLSPRIPTPPPKTRCFFLSLPSCRPPHCHFVPFFRHHALSLYISSSFFVMMPSPPKAAFSFPFFKFFLAIAWWLLRQSDPSVVCSFPSTSDFLSHFPPSPFPFFLVLLGGPAPFGFLMVLMVSHASSHPPFSFPPPRICFALLRSLRFFFSLPPFSHLSSHFPPRWAFFSTSV